MLFAEALAKEEASATADPREPNYMLTANLDPFSIFPTFAISLHSLR